MFKFLKKEKPKFIVENDYPYVQMPMPQAEMAAINEFQFKRGAPGRIISEGVVQDSAHALTEDSAEFIKGQFNLNNSNMPLPVFSWFASYAFIGYQNCAMLMQASWLIDKACTMPAKDAVRKGYMLTINDGTKINPKILDKIRYYDKKYKINKNLIEFIRMGKCFGVRIAIFKVESTDPDFYELPFNIDGVTPGSYKGIAQVDPYWCVPQLSAAAVSQMDAIDFYEPTHWFINGTKYHKSHLIIFRNSPPADIYKPTYFYGGIPLPQLIWERVYNAERTANEACMLTMTKRTNTLYTDITKAMSKQGKIVDKIQEFMFYRSNYAFQVLDVNEKLELQDTSLTDLDTTIMTQYQLVAAVAGVPATKLLGTTPKGFNATGEYEESNYHEELETLQAEHLTDLLDRHYLLTIKSDIMPEFSIAQFDAKVVWKSLDSMTAKEQAEVNEIKGRTDISYVANGALDAEDIRNRIINDPDSGYSGIDPEVPEIEEDFEDSHVNIEEEIRD